MINKNFSVTLYLGYLGLLPFFISYISVLFLPQIQVISEQAFTIYSIIIIAFMSGIHWGFALTSNKEKSKKFVVSTVPPVLVWIFFLSTPTPLFIIFLGFMHIAGLKVDRIVFGCYEIQPHYYSMRLRLAITVAMLHFLIAYATY
jgi:hypothetical protein